MKIILIIIFFSIIALLIWLHLNNLKKIRISRERILQLEHLLEDERNKRGKIGGLDRYKKLESKVKELNASAQTIGSAKNIEEQIVQLEDFFASHFKTRPPYISKLCKQMKRMVLADDRIQQLHGRVMRPLQGMLYTQEVTDDPNVQRMVLAHMIDALWIAFDAVETIADGDNIRPEQQLSIDFLSGKSTRSEIINEARTITTDPEQTPKWLRVIRRTVLPLELDAQYPVMYSGYKLQPINTEVNETMGISDDFESEDGSSSQIEDLKTMEKTTEND